MSIFDSGYITGVSEAFALSQELVHKYDQDQKTGEYSGCLSHIETFADHKFILVSSELTQSLDLDVPSLKNSKPNSYWRGVRDIARLLLKLWLQSNHSVSAFQFSSYNMIQRFRKQVGISDNNPLDEFLTEKKSHSRDAPIRSNLPAEILDSDVENDEILSQSLRDALVILRDEPEKRGN